VLLRVISGLGNEFLNLLLKCTFDLRVAFARSWMCGRFNDDKDRRQMKEMEMVGTERERERMVL